MCLEKRWRSQSAVEMIFMLWMKKGAKGEIHTNYPIEKIAVAENGIVSTILNNENSPMVVCYDATGNVLVEHRASLTGTGYPIGIALSPNGTRLQISYLCVADGVEATRVGYLNFDNTEEANKEYQVADDVYKKHNCSDFVFYR